MFSGCRVFQLRPHGLGQISGPGGRPLPSHLSMGFCLQMFLYSTIFHNLVDFIGVFYYSDLDNRLLSGVDPILSNQ